MITDLRFNPHSPSLHFFKRLSDIFYTLVCCCLLLSGRGVKKEGVGGGGANLPLYWG